MLRIEMYRGQISLLSTNSATKADVKCQQPFEDNKACWWRGILFRFCLRPSITIVPSWDKDQEAGVGGICSIFPLQAATLPPSVSSLSAFLPHVLLHISSTALKLISPTWGWRGEWLIYSHFPSYNYDYDWYAHGHTVNIFTEVKDIKDTLDSQIQYSWIPHSDANW